MGVVGDGVVDAVIDEGHKSLLADRIPQAQFSGDAVAEPVEDGQAVRPLGRCGQSEEFTSLDVVQKGLVGRRCGVMEFVDHDDIEVFRADSGRFGRDSLHAMSGLKRRRA